MNTLRTFAVVLSIISLSAITACGSKSKKATSAATPTTTSTADTAEAPVETDSASATTEPDGVDPASLRDKILFEFDSNTLGDEARASLDENARWLKEDGKRELLIEGHTDESGTNEYNLGLGEQRARAAKDYLVALGIAERRIKIITYGEERPDSNEDAQNRRSVFVATKK